MSEGFENRARGRTAVNSMVWTNNVLSVELQIE